MAWEKLVPVEENTTRMDFISTVVLYINNRHFWHVCLATS